LKGIFKQSCYQKERERRGTPEHSTRMQGDWNF